jgi:UDP-glucose 4-epimerase
MVLPRFVSQAVAGEPVTVYGDGSQTRCFGHVYDTVEALIRLLESDSAPGRVFNVGCETSISILDLARRVIARARSASEIRFVPYEDAYGDGFEELGRRVPDTAAVRELTGWAPSRSIDEAIDDVIIFERARGLTRMHTGNGLPPDNDRGRFARSRQGGAHVGG